MRRLRSWLATLAGVVCAGGCATPGPALHDYSVRPLQAADADTAFGVAESVLLEFGYEIGTRDPVAGRLATVPIESTEAAASEGASLRAARLRRVAQIRVVRAEEETQVYCNVSLEQLRTEAHRWLAFDRSSSDMPGRTPIEREAGTTTEQNTVWEAIHRDKAAERAILAAIVERLGGAPPPSVP